MSAYDYATASRALYSVSMRVARRYGVEHWHEDIAQEALSILVVCQRDGIHGGERMFRLLALQAISRIFRPGSANQPRLRMERHEEVDDRVMGSTGKRDPGLRAIALWRLQDVWPTLTAAQRDVTTRYLTGERASDENKGGATQVLSVVMAKLNREAPPVRKVGTRHAERDARIRRMVADGMSRRAVARELGLTNVRVGVIVAGQTGVRRAA